MQTLHCLFLRQQAQTLNAKCCSHKRGLQPQFYAADDRRFDSSLLYVDCFRGCARCWRPSHNCAHVPRSASTTFCSLHYVQNRRASSKAYGAYRRLCERVERICARFLLSEVFERLNAGECGRKCCLQSIGVRVLPTRLATSLNILALLSLATSTVVPCNAGICVISGEQASNLAEKKRIELFFSSFSELFNTQTATICGTAFLRAFFWLLSAIMRVQKSKLTLKNVHNFCCLAVELSCRC